MENTNEQKEPTEKEKLFKKINGFKITATPHLKKNDDYPTITYKINNDLRELLRDLCVLTETKNESYYFGIVKTDDDGDSIREEKKFKRYLIKTYIARSLSRSYEKLLFSKELLDNGVLKICFGARSYKLDFEDAFKKNINDVINVYLDLRTSQTTTFNLLQND